MSQELDLNLLRAFDALVQNSSVTEASAQLHLSIPATSRALGRLRRALNDPVLVRSGRAMAPTPFALQASAQVRSILDSAAALVSADRELQLATLTRDFTIRINDGVAATLAAVAIAGVTSAAPGVTLRFVAEGSESVEALRDGTVDVDVGVGAPTAPDIHGTVLYTERLVGIASIDTPVGRRRRPTLAQICEQPHVSTSRRGRAHGPIDDVLAVAGMRRTVGAVVPTFATALFLAASSSYIGLVPQRLAEQRSAQLGLSWFRIPAPLPEIDITMQWHNRLDGDPAQTWLRTMIEESMK
jgi:DNA-binding transcriptional LysR family regulator